MLLKKFVILLFFGIIFVKIGQSQKWLQSIKRAIEPYQRQKAEERQLNANPSGKKLDPSVNLIQGDRTLDKVAGFVGDSRNTLSKAEKIVEAAEQTIRGVKSIDNWFSDHTNNKTEWDEFSHKSFMGKRI